MNQIFRINPILQMHLVDSPHILPRQQINNTVPDFFLIHLYLISNFIVFYFSECYMRNSLQIYNYFQSHFGLKEQTVTTLVDSIANFAVASLTWLILASPILVNPFTEVFCTGLISSLIDLDRLFHRFVEQSQPSNYYNVAAQPRAFLHNSFTLLVLNVALWRCLSPIYGEYQAGRVGLMFFIAWFTHHAKDAHRNGFWFGSWFKTMPVKFLTSFEIAMSGAIITRNLLNLF